MKIMMFLDIGSKDRFSMREFSRIVANLQGQKMFQILAQANKLEQKGNSVIHLEIGDPDFDN